MKTCRTISDDFKLRKYMARWKNSVESPTKQASFAKLATNYHYNFMHYKITDELPTNMTHYKIIDESPTK